MTGGGGDNGNSDPFGDLFSEQYNPHLAFARTAANQAVELHDRAEAELKAAMSGVQQANAVAASGRKSSTILLDRLATQALRAVEIIDSAGSSGAADEAFVAYDACQQIADELRHAIGAIGRPDQPPPTYHEPEITVTDEWKNVVHKTRQRTMQWLEANRSERGKMLILKPSPSCGKPLHEDTLVTMSDGSRRRIADLRPGDQVVSGGGRITTVSAVYDQGELDVYRVVTRAGREFVAEASHRFLTQRGWLRVDELRPWTSGSTCRPRGDRVVALGNFEREPTVTMSVEEARFLGYIVGDGGVSTSSRRFTNIDPVVRAEFARCVSYFGASVTPDDHQTLRIRSPRTWTALTDDQKRERGTAHARARRQGQKLSSLIPLTLSPIRRVLDRHGLTGKKSADKRVPSDLFCSSDSAVLAFIAAYFECDGERGDNRRGATAFVPSISSVNKPLLSDVQTLLTRFSIHTSIRLKRGRYKGRVHLSWRLNILDASRFFDLVPVLGAKSGRVIRTKIKTRLATTQPRDNSEHPGCKKGRLHDLPSTLGTRLFDTIVKVEPAERARCYCITVADDESFLANDLVTHNTETALEAALEEQEQRRRVVMAARTKAVLIDELAPRLQRKRPLVRLHVILGRDPDTCMNHKNVAAVTAHGYAPGRTICVSCPHYPANAVPLGVQMCGYYESRIKAHNDSRLARWGSHRHYPIILTTHAGLLSAFHSGGGKWGAFWQTDTIFVDEDPTEAFEPTIDLTEEQLGFSSVLEEDRYTSGVAKAMLDTIRLAKEQRRAWESDPLHKENELHSHRSGSVYAGRVLHSLFQAATNGNVLTLMRDACDRAVSLGQGSLFGLESARDINGRGIPPAHFPRFAGTLMDELNLARVMSAILYQEVHERPLSPLDPPQSDQLARIDPPDTTYAIRLEYDQKTRTWRFVLQDSTDLGNHTANVVIGDAYAHVGHYRQMFQTPEPTDTNDQDRMTVVDYVAHFPPESTVVRIRTKSNVTHLAGGYLQENLSLLHAMMSERGENKRLLIYVHKRLTERVVEYLTANATSWGCTEWAVEHWWGGRGKDQYKHFDIVVALSEPLMNLGGMLHVINARAFRDAGRAKTPADRLKLGERIGLPALNKGVAHGMGRDTTHWRVAQEHQRQNVNELAQAIHRVRGLMVDGKLMIIMGDALELPRDVLAATSMVSVDGHRDGAVEGQERPRKGRMVDMPPLGCISANEVVESILAVIDHYGCWSPLWRHALLSLPWGHQSSNEDSIKAPILIESSFGLVQRIWTPPPYWQVANDSLRSERCWTMREVATKLTKLVTDGELATVAAPQHQALGTLRQRPVIHYRPSVCTASQATQAFADVMDQYGRTQKGTMHPENPKEFVPF